MRRRDHADVDVDRLRLADAPDLAAIEHAQQLRLEVERELADLVEEQRAAVRGLDQALLVAGGAGEAALRVAEQLATRSARAGSSRSRRRRTGPSRAGSCWWTASAIASLPVPVSPCSRIVASVGAALREQREQPLHRQRRAEHVAEAIARPVAERRRWCRSARRRPRCACRAAAAPAPVSTTWPISRAAVLGAVRGVEVADLDAVAAHADLEVVARHGRVGEHEVVVGVRADHRRALVEHVLLALVGAADHAQPEAALDEQPARRRRSAAACGSASPISALYRDGAAGTIPAPGTRTRRAGADRHRRCSNHHRRRRSPGCPLPRHRPRRRRARPARRATMPDASTTPASIASVPSHIATELYVCSPGVDLLALVLGQVAGRPSRSRTRGAA